MEQSYLERQLVRCRYLITRGAVERLGLRDLSAIKSTEDLFIRECHYVYKKAQGILTSTTLELEAEIQRLSGENKKSPVLKRYKYWIQLLESCYESFLWLGFSESDLVEIYKGPKYGRLSAQNVESVLAAARHYNQDPYAFAVPLDFTRFSCISDLLLLERHPGHHKRTLIEMKEGSVNEAMVTAIESRDPARVFEFADKYGQKGIEQAERFFRQVEVFMERKQMVGVRSGTFKRGTGKRIIVESKATPEYFTSVVEDLCQKARRGKYAAKILDGCLMVAAADMTSEKKYMLAEFDARLLVFNAFITTEETSKYPPDHFVAELKKIDLIDWREGLGSIFFIPPLMRDLKSRSFLDLLFGRLRLFCYLDASGFLELCRNAGLKAGFLSRRLTNRLKSQQGWSTDEYPTFEGRALGYVAGKAPMILGSVRLHQMAFNWMTPSSVASEIAIGVSQLNERNFDVSDGAEERGFTEQDLEY
ncbi:MAG TPA: hypothetical protein VN875_09080 [Candidatus Binatus sp.]|nr:hypothetical protein [Candidatus Binatus sp.]